MKQWDLNEMAPPAGVRRPGPKSQSKWIQWRTYEISRNPPGSPPMQNPHLFLQSVRRICLAATVQILKWSWLVSLTAIKKKNSSLFFFFSSSLLLFLFPSPLRLPGDWMFKFEFKISNFIFQNLNSNSNSKFWMLISEQYKSDVSGPADAQLMPSSCILTENPLVPLETIIRTAVGTSPSSCLHLLSSCAVTTTRCSAH